jgi:hypothetical protein
MVVGEVGEENSRVRGVPVQEEAESIVAEDSTTGQGAPDPGKAFTGLDMLFEVRSFRFIVAPGASGGLIRVRVGLMSGQFERGALRKPTSGAINLPENKDCFELKILVLQFLDE